MTIRDLIGRTTWPEVKRAMKYFYPKDKGDYEEVFKYFASVETGPPLRKKEKIEVYMVFEEAYLEDTYYSVHTNLYSLSLREWPELASIPFSKVTLRNYRPAELAAHFIWEVTYYGTPKDIAKLKAELIETTKKIKEQHHGK